MAKKKKIKTTKLKIVRLDHGQGLPLPTYQTKHAAGLDLLAAVKSGQEIKLKPGARALVPTGLCFEIPEGFEAQVRPRSGLALKHGVTVLNTPGTIDSDYRGEIGVILINLGTKTFKIRRGERVAQVVMAPVTRVKVKSAKKLAKSQRGADGFGSTGTGSVASKTNKRTGSKSAKKRTKKAKRTTSQKSKTSTSRRSKSVARTRTATKKKAPSKARVLAKAKPRTSRKQKARLKQNRRTRHKTT